jgi:hypothetical protein
MNKASICRDLRAREGEHCIGYSARTVWVIAQCSVHQILSSSVPIVANIFENCLLPSQRIHVLRLASSAWVTFALAKFRLCFYRDKGFRFGLRFLRTVLETPGTRS